MDKNEYFARMRETSDLVYPLIEEQIEGLAKEDAILRSIVRYVADKRDRHLLLRPFLIRLTYELTGGKDWERTIAVGAAFELLNISSYQANSAFDSKYRVLTSQQRNSQFIASMVTRELAEDTLRAARSEFSGDVVEVLMQDLSASNRNMYLAQHYDMNLLTVANGSRYSDESVFLAGYTRRCWLGCGIFTGLCARAGGVLASAQPDSLAALQRFGEEFGTALQIVNDLADFVPPNTDPVVAVDFQDQFSDLRNGRLTLGCYKLLRECGAYGEAVVERVANGDTIDDTEFSDITAVMVKEGVVDGILEETTSHEVAARQALDFYPDGGAKEYLSQMLTVCHVNKFTLALGRHRDIPPAPIRILGGRSI